MISFLTVLSGQAYGAEGGNWHRNRREVVVHCKSGLMSIWEVEKHQRKPVSKTTTTRARAEVDMAETKRP
jgi:hypothetical protein